MPTKYDLGFMDNSSNIVDLYTGINAASNSVLAIMFLVIIWVIFTILLQERGILNAIVFSSFITTLVSLLFLGLGWITTPVFLICLGIMLISIFMVYMSNK